MAELRLTHAAEADILAILAWSDEQFGEEASRRYEALIVAAIRDAASGAELGRVPRPELGAGAFSWHLRQSRDRVPGRHVGRPRHFLVCRLDGDVLVVGRVLHDAMDLPGHIDSSRPWA